MLKDSMISYILKRNGVKQHFDPKRILVAIEKAFLSEGSIAINQDTLESLTNDTIELIKEKLSNEKTVISVEDIQDIVETVLMKRNFHKIAKKYILYRVERQKEREQNALQSIKESKLSVKETDGSTSIFDSKNIHDQLSRLSSSLKNVSLLELLESLNRQLYDSITRDEISSLLLNVIKEKIELHPDYSSLASRVVVDNLYQKLLGATTSNPKIDILHQKLFPKYIYSGVQDNVLSKDLLSFDLELLASHLVRERDFSFYYLGIQILTDRYLIRNRSKHREIVELPQWFWMRVAMGLAIQEPEKEKYAIAFYEVLSSFDLISSTPTLFNSGTNHSQMSSCYLNTVEDSLTHIFKVYSDNAQLSKWAGGIGTDWSKVRASGSNIIGTNGKSQGVIPFIKIFNDVALAVNQGGKRKGAMCAYIEIWHRDFEQFLELKKNTGDERRRAHDINTASWIPDLFMKRMLNGQNWTLFCPSEVPDLHNLYGKEFEDRYCFYESQNLSSAKSILATDLWRKMVTMLYETGHPWITFKDPSNIRNPQKHDGVIHSSNLCTEIVLNTSESETAVCNLASINLSNMIVDGQLDEQKIEKTISIGIRMLDNVIDNNFYPTIEAKNSNQKSRSLGLGMMGYQDALYQLDINFDSEENIHFADLSMEIISFYAILSSSKLAKERGSYPSYQGSLWSENILPIDSISLLEEERGEIVEMNRSVRKNWSIVREHIKKYGMRNANILAIAPTATIANIAGVYPCTEPAFKNIYMKENLSGNFIVINRYLIEDLCKLGLWTSSILQEIKRHNGSLSAIRSIPDTIRQKYKETFDIDMTWIVECASRRAKWIDQSASTNIFMTTTSGKLISDIYIKCWKLGLKTTYYFRTLAASQTTKASVSTENFTNINLTTSCSIDNPENCEACQ